MPSFGEYETIGEPVFVTQEAGHVSTVWKARRGAAERPVYSIKCFKRAFLDRPTPDPIPETEDELGNDSELQFLEDVKRLKKAHTETPSHLATIHAFGGSAEGVWYVTDYCQRKTLKEFIALRGEVDSRALAQVVWSAAAGCAALKRSGGVSHGNLKASNVLLTGKPQPLPVTPLHLIDPKLPEGSCELSTEILGPQSEASDLKAIGELILQLVEGRIIKQAFDYNYPIGRSAAWQRLGKDAEIWRQLCNRLLKPDLVPGEMTLEALAKDFRPDPILANLPRFAMIAGAVVVILGFGFWFSHRGSKRGADLVRAAPASPPNTEVPREPAVYSEYANQLVQAQQAYAKPDYIEAFNRAAAALRAKPNDELATRLRNDAQRQLEIEKDGLAQKKKLADALQSAQGFLNAKNYSEAFRQAQVALLLAPQDPIALGISRDAQRGLDQYQAALKRAQDALSQKRYDEVLTQTALALQNNPNDPEATTLKARAEDAVKRYETAMTEARNAIGQKRSKDALIQVQNALALKPADSAALTLQNELNLADKDAKYQMAMNAAKEALRQKRYGEVVTQAGIALEKKQNDPEAGNLKSQAEDAVRRYNLAVSEARKAFAGKRTKDALTQIQIALGINPGDATAITLQNQINVADKDANYRAAIEAAKEAFQQKHYTDVLTLVGSALANKPGDQDAANLKRQVEDALRRYEIALSEAQKALGEKRTPDARIQIQTALAIKPGDAAAKTLENQIDLAERDANYQRAMEQATKAWKEKRYTDVLTQTGIALENRPKDPEATTLNGQAEEAIRRYDIAMSEARKALGEKRAKDARSHLQTALGIKPTDAAGLALQKQTDLLDKEVNYQAAMDEGNNAWKEKRYSDVVTQTKIALLNRPKDQDAAALKGQAEETLKRYEIAMSEARKALDEKRTKDARKHVRTALVILPGDTAGTALQNQIELTDKDINYEIAIEQAQNAFKQKRYSEVLSLAPIALENRTNDILASQLLSEAEQQMRAFDSALTNADNALRGEQYPEALKYVGVALQISPDDDKTKRLKARVENEQRQVCTTALTFAKEALAKNDRTRAQNMIAAALRARPNDEAALQLQSEIQKGAPVEAPVATEKPPAVDFARLDKRLDNWELLFSRPGGGRPIHLSGPMKSWVVEEIGHMESLYGSAGGLGQRQQRLNALRQTVNAN